MDGAEKKAKKIFGKKWDFVQHVIKKNQEKLRKLYVDMLSGAMPESISLNLEQETESKIPNFLKY